jgi:hypothetical protein
VKTTRSCALCEWAYSDPRYPPTGRFQCRRFPPANTEMRRSPQVNEFDWCGEFMPRATAETAAA